jgi:hypothetical protein
MARIIFIGGTNFCGSTLLSFLLGSHPDCFATGEIHHFYFDQDHFCSIHWGKCDFWTEDIRKACFKNPKYYDLIRDYILERKNTSVILHSSKLMPNLRVHLDNQNQLDGIIFLFKRPEAYYKSVAVHMKNMEVDKNMSDYVRVYGNLLERANREGIPYRVVFYDDLATNTKSILVKLCEFTGISYREEMLEPWRKSDDFHTVAGNTGMYMHVWGRDFFEKELNKEYWKNTYSEEHNTWIRENFRKISLDEKWKTLDPEILKKIAGHKPVQEMFARLMGEKIEI